MRYTHDSDEILLEIDNTEYLYNEKIKMFERWMIKDKKVPWSIGAKINWASRFVDRYFGDSARKKDIKQAGKEIAEEYENDYRPYHIRGLGMGAVDTYSQGTSDYGTKRRILEDVRSISSGTMATMLLGAVDPARKSGYRVTMGDTDFVQRGWIDYVDRNINHKRQWQNWIDTWKDFVKEDKIKNYVVMGVDRKIYDGYCGLTAREYYNNAPGTPKIFINGNQVG